MVRHPRSHGPPIVAKRGACYDFGRDRRESVVTVRREVFVFDAFINRTFPQLIFSTAQKLPFG